MKMRSACATLPRVCPGPCNPRNRRLQGVEKQQPQQQRVVNRNVIYNPEFALFSRRSQPQPSPCQRAAARPGSPALSPEDQEFVAAVARRVQERRRARTGRDCRRAKRLVAFIMFFMLHGLVALWTKNYQHYQTFLATQFCGFITIMFWEDKSS